MHLLSFDPDRSSRPNTFHVAEGSTGLYRLRAYIRTTNAAELHVCDAWFQLHDRLVVRQRDPDGHPALLASRMGTGDGEFALESARLHVDLPCSAYALHGWRP